MKLDAKKLEVSWIVFIDETGKRLFKVTHRIPELSVSETRIFNSKKEAKKQFEKWLL